MSDGINPCEPVGRKLLGHELSQVKKVIAVIGGKGGVGKSMVTAMLAVLMNRAGYNTAILDADITGPSVPKMFGLTGKAEENELGVFPVRSKMGIPVISLNLMLFDETDPVIWRGPVLAERVKKFWTDVVWGKQDFMFVDMPPGTGDIPLTVLHSLPVDGIIVVSTPQELVGMIVEKAVNMAQAMCVPVLSYVENMGYFKCSDCGKEHVIFGKSRAEEITTKYGIKTVCRLPVSEKLAAAADAGTIELFDEPGLEKIVEQLANML